MPRSPFPTATAPQYVRLAVYRAQYQHGDPLYPPRAVSFLVGPSPTQLYPASPVYPCRLTDAAQVFALDRAAPPGGFLLVRLHGKMQKQWEGGCGRVPGRALALAPACVPVHAWTELLRVLPRSTLPQVRAQCHRAEPCWMRCLNSACGLCAQTCSSTRRSATCQLTATLCRRTSSPCCTAPYAHMAWPGSAAHPLGWGQRQPSCTQAAGSSGGRGKGWRGSMPGKLQTGRRATSSSGRRGHTQRM